MQKYSALAILYIPVYIFSAERVKVIVHGLSCTYSICLVYIFNNI